MTQYFFDVTALRSHMARHVHVSGIQRVSIMTIDRARLHLGAERVWLGYHDRPTDSYRVIRCPTEPGADLTDYAVLCGLLGVRPSDRQLPAQDKSKRRRPVKRQLKIWKRDLYAWLGIKRHFLGRGLSPAAWRAARRGETRPASEYSPEGSAVGSVVTALERVARPGDCFVLLDNAWHPRGLDAWLKRASLEMGLSVCVLLHDLIPLVTPQYTEANICVRFHDWLVDSTTYVTRYLANSENTGRDLQRFLDDCGASQPVDVVPLARSAVSWPGPGLEPVAVSRPEAPYEAFLKGRTMPDHIRALTKTAYVLIVGTMEVRKNLWRVATAWDRLRRLPGRELPKLVIAGRKGWLNEDFDALMAATGRLGGWVEIVESPSDQELDYLYRNCLFTITASFYEGWGLPIGESLGYGKTAVVSKTSAMPEVGGDMVIYCDPHSLDDIEAACLRLIDDAGYRHQLEQRIAAATLRTWDDVARDMLIAVTGRSSDVPDAS